MILTRLSFEDTLALVPFTPSAEQEAYWKNLYEGTGNLVVEAYAGTGKTTSTVYGFLFLPPTQKVLFCAFMKKNAIDAEAKVKEVFSLLPAGTPTPSVEVRTLHSQGSRFCSSYNKSRYDSDRDYRIAKAVTPKMAPRGVTFAVKKLVSWVKGTCPEPTRQDLEFYAQTVRGVCSDYLDSKRFDYRRLAGLAAQALDLAKRSDGGHSFDDMVWLPVVNQLARAYYDVVFVDECQDMNFTQIRLAQLCCKKSGRIIVIGDRNQAIYGFRGADSRSIVRLIDELDAQVLTLSVTYRCAKAIVALAQQLVPGFTAWSQAPEGSITRIGVEDLAEEVGPEVAVLSRLNAPLVPLCLQLLAQDIPAYVEGRNIAAQISGLIKENSFGGKEQSIPKLFRRLAAWEQSQQDRLRAALSADKDEEKLEASLQQVSDQAECVRALTDGLSSVNELLARVSGLFADSVDKDGNVLSRKARSVVFSSIHKAKGLEWGKVLVLDDTIRRNGVTEEQNLEYVAITRAKAELVFVDGLD